MIPNFNTEGLLPNGIHWATWDELEKRFGHNAHRKALLRGLNSATAALKYAGCPTLYLDGSFVTEKEIPDDYDACYELFGVDFTLMDPVFLDFSNRRAAQKAKYLGEFFPTQARADAAPPFRTYLEFFQVDKHTGGTKGIIGLQLK